MRLTSTNNLQVKTGESETTHSDFYFEAYELIPTTLALQSHYVEKGKFTGTAYVQACAAPLVNGYDKQITRGILTNNDNINHTYYLICNGVQYLDGFQLTPSQSLLYVERGLEALGKIYAPPVPSGLAVSAASGGSLTNGTTYYYVISGVYSYGESLPSSEVSIHITSPNQTADLTWTALPGNPKGVNVYRGTSSGGENKLVTTTAGNATSYNDTGSAGTSATPSSGVVLDLVAGETDTSAGLAFGFELVNAFISNMYFNAASTVQGVTVGTGVQTIVSTPTPGTVTQVLRGWVTNEDTVTRHVNIYINDNGTTTYLLNSFALNSGETFEWAWVGAGWMLFSKKAGSSGGGSVSFPITVAEGGTGLTSLTAHAVLLGEGTSNVGFATIGTAGRILVDQGSADPAFEVVSGSGATITLSASGVFTISNIANASLVDSSITITTTAPLTGGGTVALGGTLTIAANVFGASGPSHSTGIVPDPGASAGTIRFLREDATWQTPLSGGNIQNVIEKIRMSAFSWGFDSSVQVLLAFAKTTNNCSLLLDWFDVNITTGALGPVGRDSVFTNGTGVVVVDTGPASGYRRYCSSMVFRNLDTVTTAPTLEIIETDTGTGPLDIFQVGQITLQVNETWYYHNGEFYVLDANGNRK